MSSSKSLLTLPNLVTLSRLVMLAPFLYFLHLDVSWGRPAALSAGIIIGLTDFLDGYLSRKMDQVSDLGKALDPIVDKIVGIAILIGLYFFRELPLAFIIFKATKELLLGIRSAIALKKWKEVPSANIWGKTSFVALMITMMLYVLRIRPRIGICFLIVTALVETAALVSYYVELIRGEKE